MAFLKKLPVKRIDQNQSSSGPNFKNYLLAFGYFRQVNCITNI